MQLLIQINTKIVFILFLFWGVSSFANEANTTDNPPVKKYYVHDIKNAMNDHIANSVDEEWCIYH